MQVVADERKNKKRMNCSHESWMLQQQRLNAQTNCSVWSNKHFIMEQQKAPHEEGLICEWVSKNWK
jgi:hypothetical protein